MMSVHLHLGTDKLAWTIESGWSDHLCNYITMYFSGARRCQSAEGPKTGGARRGEKSTGENRLLPDSYTTKASLRCLNEDIRVIIEF